MIDLFLGAQRKESSLKAFQFSNYRRDNFNVLLLPEGW